MSSGAELFAAARVGYDRPPGFEELDEDTGDQSEPVQFQRSYRQQDYEETSVEREALESLFTAGGVFEANGRQLLNFTLLSVGDSLDEFGNGTTPVRISTINDTSKTPSELLERLETQALAFDPSPGSSELLPLHRDDARLKSIRDAAQQIDVACLSTRAIEQLTRMALDSGMWLDSMDQVCLGVAEQLRENQSSVIGKMMTCLKDIQQATRSQRAQRSTQYFTDCEPGSQDETGVMRELKRRIIKLERVLRHNEFYGHLSENIGLVAKPRSVLFSFNGLNYKSTNFRIPESRVLDAVRQVKDRVIRAAYMTRDGQIPLSVTRLSDFVTSVKQVYTEERTNLLEKTHYMLNREDRKSRRPKEALFSKISALNRAGQLFCEGEE